MKTKSFKLMLFVIILFGASISASAQIYIKVRPAVPVVVRTERPSPNHVWINEEWREDGAGYKYAGGHWEARPHDGDRWTNGYWEHSNHGDRWHNGSWKNRGNGNGRKGKR